MFRINTWWTLLSEYYSSRLFKRSLSGCFYFLVLWGLLDNLVVNQSTSSAAFRIPDSTRKLRMTSQRGNDTIKTSNTETETRLRNVHSGPAPLNVCDFLSASSLLLLHTFLHFLFINLHSNIPIILGGGSGGSVLSSSHVSTSNFLPTVTLIG